MNLLKQQKPLIKKYWNLASDEISLFQNKEVDGRRGVAVPDRHAEGRRAAVADTIPSEGATGWADS